MEEKSRSVRAVMVFSLNYIVLIAGLDGPATNR